MFIQGRRHLGILRRAKPLPAAPHCRRWQRGRETSCSCLVSVQECREHVQLSGSYLRGSAFGHGNSVHKERYARTPRTCPTLGKAVQDKAPPVVTGTYTSQPCCTVAETPEARTVSYRNHMHLSRGSYLQHSALVWWLYCFWLQS